MTLFEDIADEISQRINEGFYSANSSLPNEIELQAKYGVSRSTVHKAIDILVEQHKVVRKRGVGLFLAPEISAQNILEMTGVAKPASIDDFKVIMRDKYLRKAGPLFAHLLHIQENELVYYVSFLQQGGEKVTKEVLILPLQYFPDFDVSVLKVVTVLETMSSGKRKVADMEQQLQLITGSTELVKQLQISENAPVFKTVNFMYTEGGDPIALETRFEPAEVTKYVVDF